MAPRESREVNEEAASRQLINSNNTLSHFLGGSHTRRMSWLNGGTTSISSSRPVPAPTSPERTRERSKETNTSTEAHRANTSSTSNSPSLPNNVPVMPPQQSAQASISPPQTPTTRMSPVPLNVMHVEPHENGRTFHLAPAADETRKRKSADAQNLAAPAKRLSMGVGNAASSPLNPYSPKTSASASEAMMQSSSTTAANMAMRPPAHNRQASGPNINWQQAYQGYGADVSRLQSHHRGRPPSRIQTQHQHMLPSNATTHTQSPTLHQAANTALRQSSAASPVVASPPAQSPGNHYPSPQSAAGRTNMTTLIDRSIAQQSTPTTPLSPPIANRPSLPVLLPYNAENCANRINTYRTEQQQSLAGVENSRIELLVQAARENDSLFLFVHQICSQHAINVAMIPSILRNAEGFQSTMGIMNGLLAGDDIKNKDLLLFFSGLPCSLNYLAMERPDNYQMLLSHMKHLSSSLQNDWPTLKAMCLHRGYPPLATELWVLNMFSPTMMDVFFLSIVRQIWPNQLTSYTNGSHDEAKRIFDDNKQMLYTSLTGWQLHPDTLAQITTIFHRRFAFMLQKMGLARAPPMQSTAWQPQASLVGNGQVDYRASHSPHLPTMQAQEVQHRPHPPPTLYSNDTRVTTPVQPVQPNNGMLIPAAGAARPNQAATATWQLSALHQAHLREPRFDVPENPTQDELLYQSVHAFAAIPTRLEGDKPYQRIVFNIPAAASIAKTTCLQDGQRKVRKLDEESLQFRLRIVKVGCLPTDKQQDALDKDWLLKPTSWPQNFYYTLNGSDLEVRRKQHHTKDLPVDITEYVRPDQNALEIFANVAYEEAFKLLPQYAFAIEVIGVNTHKTIMEQCQRRVISSEDSLRAITVGLKRSTLSTEEEDDDLIIDDARTNIMIYDPICQGKICDIPARGEDCKHRECFDLLTFLQTRPREKPSWPSEADAWKCPICLLDVRPARIVVDGFLKEVKDKLISEGKEKTRTIVVEASGSWAPKIEENGGDSGRSTPEAEEASMPAMFSTNGGSDTVPQVTTAIPPPTAAPLQVPRKRQPIVIDLSDDD